jgi:hypothetical protein
MIFVMNWCLSAAKYCRNALLGWAEFLGHADDRRLRDLRRCKLAGDANNGAGVLTDFPTLQEAVLAWRSLAPEQKSTVKQ